ncbi:MAG: hypothetical protein F6J89_08285 [Symploca sp. SIO1C4]|uniref:Uncharacterized protein n=1 Tax=Symploca sp. SIO1C4 TaxID=2607765 RepID=A0A6B3N373_9CYAN|nr:hypothetical protein [Symploca sp. SIO1C4]
MTGEADKSPPLKASLKQCEIFCTTKKTLLLSQEPKLQRKQLLASIIAGFDIPTSGT